MFISLITKKIAATTFEVSGERVLLTPATGFALLKPMIRQVITNELQRRLMPPADPNQSGFPLSKR